MNKIDLNKRVAIVTGGAQGFGLAITKRFLESGCEVVIWDIDKKEIEKVQSNFKKEKLTSQIVDVTNYKDIQKNLDSITKS